MELVRPDSVSDAVAALGNGAVALGGGTDLVPRWPPRPDRRRGQALVELRNAVPKGIDGTKIGAGTTLAELEADTEIPEALREACRLRLRRSSVPSERSAATSCRRRAAGTGASSSPAACTAATAAMRARASTASTRSSPNDFCASAHPSDPAAALLALGTTVRTDRRELPLAELYKLPTEDDRSTTHARPADELIVELDVPRPDAPCT